MTILEELLGKSKPTPCDNLKVSDSSGLGRDILHNVYIKDENDDLRGVTKAQGAAWHDGMLSIGNEKVGNISGTYDQETGELTKISLGKSGLQDEVRRLTGENYTSGNYGPYIEFQLQQDGSLQDIAWASAPLSRRVPVVDQGRAKELLGDALTAIESHPDFESVKGCIAYQADERTGSSLTYPKAEPVLAVAKTISGR